MISLVALLFLASACDVDSVRVADFGAVPDDGLCDREAIQAAINAAQSAQVRTGKPVIVKLDAGVYNLREPKIDADGKQPLSNHVEIHDAAKLTLLGSVGPGGGPSTVLERNVPELSNRMHLSAVVSVDGGVGIRLQDLTFDNNPRFASAGVCVKVDKVNDAVEVDVFDRVPHFDKMDAFSANVWDLATRDLRPGVPHLSIGTNYRGFPIQWRHVSGGEGRRYRIEKMGFAAHLEVGDGVSWHFNVHARGMLRCHSTDGLTLHNVQIHNGPGPVASLHGVGNLKCQRVVLAPEGNQLAVGPRDGMYTAGSHGDYLYEGCVFSGVRWDPLPLFDRLVYVEQMIDARTAEVYTYRGSKYDIEGVAALLWIDGADPVKTKIVSHKWGETDHKEPGANGVVRRGSVTFADNAPPGFGAGSAFTPIRRTSTVIRKCTFENNYGRSPYLSGVNMLIEGNVFRNNGYAFALGVSSPGAGGFVHDVTIRDNTFENCAWSTVSRGIPTSGAIRFYEEQRYEFSDEAYHSRVLIENNTFKNVGLRSNYAAIDIRNARDVTLRGNRYLDTQNTIQIHKQSTDTNSIAIIDE